VQGGGKREYQRRMQMSRAEGERRDIARAGRDLLRYKEGKKAESHPGEGLSGGFMLPRPRSTERELREPLLEKGPRTHHVRKRKFLLRPDNQGSFFFS